MLPVNTICRELKLMRYEAAIQSVTPNILVVSAMTKNCKLTKRPVNAIGTLPNIYFFHFIGLKKLS